MSSIDEVYVVIRIDYENMGESIEAAFKDKNVADRYSQCLRSMVKSREFYVKKFTEAKE